MSGQITYPIINPLGGVMNGQLAVKQNGEISEYELKIPLNVCISMIERGSVLTTS